MHFFQKCLNVFHIIIRMEQLRWQNAQERNLRRILGAKNTLLDSEKKKRKDNFIKDVINLFRLKK